MIADIHTRYVERRLSALASFFDYLNSTWILWRVGEEYNLDCIVDKEQRKQEGKFWGSFSDDLGKRSGLVWEKAWGKIERVFPLVEDVCWNQVDTLS